MVKSGLRYSKIIDIRKRFVLNLRLVFCILYIRYRNDDIKINSLLGYRKE